MVVTVRTATIGDAAGVARLVSSLGYPTSTDQMRSRLAAILAAADYGTLLACDGEAVVGFIGTRVGPLYEGDRPCGQIMALSVAGEYRRRGVGGTLVRAAEAMLVARGAGVLVVTSGNHRSEAHAFYERHGYTFTGRRYTKVLGAPAPAGEP